MQYNTIVELLLSDICFSYSPESIRHLGSIVKTWPHHDKAALQEVTSRGVDLKEEVGGMKWKMPRTRLYEPSIEDAMMDHFIQ